MGYRVVGRKEHSYISGGNAPSSNPFWAEVHNLITSINQHQLAYDSLPMPFHDTHMAVGTYKQLFISQIYIVGKCLILIYWKSSVVPMVRDWLLKVQEIKKS